MANNPRPNPLFDYANHTYKFSLYAVPKSNFNLIATGGISPGGGNAIIKGGALIAQDGGSGSQGSSFFPTDLIIDNVHLESTVGVSSRSRGHNVTDISFDIIEPYTSTFLVRLVSLGASLSEGGDWSQTMFVLRVQFIGYDEKGLSKVIPSTEKFIPFVLTDVQFKITSKGSVYSIKGLPSGQSALTPIYNVIPFHMEIQADTIENVFNASTGDLKGIAKALNDNQQDFVSTGVQDVADEFVFKIDPHIGASKLVDPKSVKEDQVPFSNAKSGQDIQNGQLGKLQADLTKGVYKINAGTRITDLINSIVSTSEYMRSQYSRSGQNTSQPLNLWKTVTTVEYKSYDKKRNDLGRKVTFYVKPFSIYGQDHPAFGQKAPPAPIKTYNYLYTGQNKDVLSVDISYTSSFYEIRNAATKALIDGQNNNIGSQPASNQDTQPVPRTGDDNKIFRPRTLYTRGDASQQHTGGFDKDVAAIEAKGLMSKIWDAHGDMVKLNITVSGDPDLIIQDDILFGANTNPNTLIYDDGTINSQDNELYFLFKFKAPLKDYSDTTGLFQLGNSSSPFEGLYRLVAVTHTFVKGHYTMKLDNFRVRNQPQYDNKNAQINAVNNSRGV
jgi:hypothetical protein